jgi:hypothetical protein
MLFPTVALLVSTPPLISTHAVTTPFVGSLGEGVLRSLSFAMQRVFFQTKSPFLAMNRAAEFALNNLAMHVVGCR